ncbi:MAG: acyltransferase [Proteobacteria bacterium]|nr:acyltransferase [Pseudomonadota bacterium]
MRIHGFDILRGLCALSVAIYHMTHWRHSADLNNVGLIGVNIFFILSGASITIAYADRLRSGLPFVNFLGQRVFRLAPLFWVLLLIVIIQRHLPLSQALLNGSFLFGFANAGEVSMVPGGWSLGIEFLFYFIFPVFLFLLGGTYRPVLVLLFLTYIQQAYVSAIVKNDGDLESYWVTYVQFASFIAYFFCGCLIGKLVPHIHLKMAWLPFIALGTLLFYACAIGDDPAVAGISGALLMGLCALVVVFSSKLSVPPKLVWLADAMGDMSYGMYLLHPLVFDHAERSFGFHLFDATGELAGTIIVIAITIILALASERYYERPIRKLGYRLLNIR